MACLPWVNTCHGTLCMGLKVVDFCSLVSKIFQPRGAICHQGFRVEWILLLSTVYALPALI
jgi:hypothetical protein